MTIWERVEELTRRVGELERATNGERARLAARVEALEEETRMHVSALDSHTERLGELEARVPKSIPVIEPVLVASDGITVESKPIAEEDQDARRSAERRFVIEALRATRAKPIGALEAINEGMAAQIRMSSDPEHARQMAIASMMKPPDPHAEARRIARLDIDRRLGRGLLTRVMAHGLHNASLSKDILDYLEDDSSRARVATQGPEDTGR